MCGRYIFISIAMLYDHYKPANTLADLKPRYNIAPGQPAPVITRTAGTNSLEQMRWGLIPRWANDPAIANKLINARAETLAEKPSFRHALKGQRCLIPCNGFYEWDKNKQPYFIQLQDQPLFSLAGLYDLWENPEGQTIKTYTIITTGPNDLMCRIHHRMPAILSQSAEAAWLDNGNKTAAELLKPFATLQMEANPISKLVNDYHNDGPELLTRTEKARQKNLHLFS